MGGAVVLIMGVYGAGYGTLHQTLTYPVEQRRLESQFGQKSKGWHFDGGAYHLAGCVARTTYRLFVFHQFTELADRMKGSRNFTLLYYVLGIGSGALEAVMISHHIDRLKAQRILQRHSS